MIKKLIILTVLIVSAQCFAADAPVDEVAALRAELASTKAELNKVKYANVPPIEQQIKLAPDNWKGAYGDTEKTQIYFNIKSAMVDIEQCKAAIRLLAAAINTITDINDPNSLAARVEVLEEKPDVFITGTINEADIKILEVDEMHEGSPVSFTAPCDAVGTVDSNKALKPDDPNEVAERTVFEKKHWEQALIEIPKEAELISVGPTNCRVEKLGIFYRMPDEKGNEYMTVMTQQGRFQAEMIRGMAK